MSAPVPVLGWDADRPTWLAARTHGLGASDVAAVLGFSRYRSPWRVWAEKTGAYDTEVLDDAGEAAQLGTDLEPYLLKSAARLIGGKVGPTYHQLYQHPDFPWRMCSPDGTVYDQVSRDPALNPVPPHLGYLPAVDGDWYPGSRGVQIKTAGIQSGYGAPQGWDDDNIPLGYELQCRWEMHVMDWQTVELIALVANRGLLRRTIDRDEQLEQDLVGQVSAWWDRHVIRGVEPPLGDSDNGLLAALYPTAERGAEVDLDGEPGVWEAWHGYRQAQTREAAAKTEKQAHGAALKKALGHAEFGKIDGDLIAAWSPKRGQVDWQRMLADVCERAGIIPPDPENYRKPSSRTLSVKEPL